MGQWEGLLLWGHEASEWSQTVPSFPHFMFLLEIFAVKITKLSATLRVACMLKIFQIFMLADLILGLCGIIHSHNPHISITLWTYLINLIARTAL